MQRLACAVSEPCLLSGLDSNRMPEVQLCFGVLYHALMDKSSDASDLSKIQGRRGRRLTHRGGNP
jgi:hypothetical protein